MHLTQGGGIIVVTGLTPAGFCLKHLNILSSDPAALRSDVKLQNVACSLVRPDSICSFVFRSWYSRRRGPGEALNTHPECIMRAGYQAALFTLESILFIELELSNPPGRPHYWLQSADCWMGLHLELWNSTCSHGGKQMMGPTVTSCLSSNNLERNLQHIYLCFFSFAPTLSSRMLLFCASCGVSLQTSGVTHPHVILKLHTFAASLNVLNAALFTCTSPSLCLLLLYCFCLLCCALPPPTVN